MRVSPQKAAEPERLEAEARDQTAPFWLGAYTWVTNALSGAWEYPVLDSQASHIILWLILLTICVLRAFLGLTGTEAFTHDPTVSLDGAWRMLNGQRPHTDFFSNLGVLAYVPTVVGLLLAHGTAQGFGYGVALTGLGLGIWCYRLCRSRLNGMSTAMLCLLVVTMATAPFSLGFPPMQLSSAMVYNRVGYALLALILVEVVTANRSVFGGTELADGLSTGAALALLCFLKITYCVGAVVMLVALTGMRRQTRPRWVGLATGFWVISMGVGLYLSFNFLPMLHNLNTILHARRMLLSWYVLDDILEHAGVLLALGFIAVGLLVGLSEWKLAGRVAVVTTATFIFGFLFILANYEQGGFPLAPFVSVLILEQIADSRDRLSAAESGPFPSVPRGWQAAVAGLAGVIICVPLLATSMSFAKGLYWKLAEAPKAKQMNSPALAGFVPEETWYTEFVNDGLALLRTNQRAGESVMCLDFSNPFPFATQSRPAEGGATALQYLSTFNASHKPVPEWLFGKANLVMVPKKFSDVTLEDSIPELYGPYLKQHFVKVAESEKWSLYRAAKPPQ